MIGDENNRVIVRIWTSEYNSTLPGKDVGHVSIEIPMLHAPNNPAYYSLWPDFTKRAGRTGYFSPIPGFYMKGYRRPPVVLPVADKQMPEYDCDAERRHAEATICLYGLNIYGIQIEFNKLKEQVTNWIMIGENKNLLQIKNNDACSCSSLAKELLIAGGIRQYIPISSNSKWSSSPTPDGFIPILVAAKRKELEKNIHYYFPGEIDIKTIKVDYLAPAKLVIGNVTNTKKTASKAPRTRKATKSK